MSLLFNNFSIFSLIIESVGILGESNSNPPNIYIKLSINHELCLFFNYIYIYIFLLKKKNIIPKSLKRVIF